MTPFSHDLKVLKFEHAYICTFTLMTFHVYIFTEEGVPMTFNVFMFTEQGVIHFTKY